MKISVRLTFMCVMCLYILSLTGCSHEALDDFCETPGIEPVKAALKTAIPLAHVAFMAMSVMSDEDVAFDEFSISTPGDSYPRVAFMTFTLHKDNMPVQFPYYGQVLVAGHWATENKAVLIILFTDMTIGTSWHAVEKVSAFPVIKKETGITMVYCSGDINIQTDPTDPSELTEEEIQTELDRLDTKPPLIIEEALEMDTWIVELQSQGTVIDYSDDVYVISGGGQYIGIGSNSGAILQLGLVLATMTPACDLNPTSGLGVIQEVRASGGEDDPPIFGQATLHFHSECDGKLRIGAANGNYICSVGKKIELDLRAD